MTDPTPATARAMGARVSTAPVIHGPRRSTSRGASHAHSTHRSIRHREGGLTPTAISRPPPLDVGRPGSEPVGAGGLCGRASQRSSRPALVNRLARTSHACIPAFRVRCVRQGCLRRDSMRSTPRPRPAHRGALATTCRRRILTPSRSYFGRWGLSMRPTSLIGVGMAPFFYLPHILFVAERGLDHFESRCGRSTS